MRHLAVCFLLFPHTAQALSHRAATKLEGSAFISGEGSYLQTSSLKMLRAEKRIDTHSEMLIRQALPNSNSTGASHDALLSKAAAVAAQLTEQERNSLLHGSHFLLAGFAPEPGYYTGYVNAIPRLAVPALKMADAGNGFRTPDPKDAGTTTCWPSLLAMAATWDESLVQRYAEALGEEFRGKGANVILGPSINVHRIARNGRNFEYLSGEDPFLGSRLVRPYIRGVQSKGVMATIKHFAFNEQETNRQSESSEVDERTAWELYYPPFQAAVEAGAGAVMCSYNKVNGTYACGNSDLLQRDLRHKMGFKGIIMSDWQAAHTADDIKNGLDQEMPGTYTVAAGKTLGPIFSEKALRSENRQESATAAAQRVLETMYRLKLHENPGCVPPDCTASLASDQTSDAHRALAHKAAATSIVLLQNDGILPLGHSHVKKIAILGAVNTTQYYQTPNGSGYVFPKSATPPLQALKLYAAKAGVAIVENLGDADAALIIAGTNSEEGVDRKSLSLDDNSDRLIAEVSKTKPTIVLLMIPGAVLMPWRSSTSAILALFLGGEQSSHAAASVLFGDVSPSGKLPVMIPESEEDAIPPSSAGSVPYSEGLLTSYRSHSFKAAFPFGHGLSYTEFLYTSPRVAPLASCGTSIDGEAIAACVHLTVTNTGKRIGTEIVQAYLQIGTKDSRSKDKTPDKVLKGFVKTQQLHPGKKQDVFMGFSNRDLSTYTSGTGWRRSSQALHLHIGSSSADIRHVLPLQDASVLSDDYTDHQKSLGMGTHFSSAALLFALTWCLQMLLF